MGICHIVGTKSFVVNAANANLFLVTAQTEVSDRKGDKKNAFSIFLVDSNLPGIRRHGKIRTIGRTNLYQASIRLEDVILSKGEMLVRENFHFVLYYILI